MFEEACPFRYITFCSFLSLIFLYTETKWHKETVGKCVEVIQNVMTSAQLPQFLRSMIIMSAQRRNTIEFAKQLFVEIVLPLLTADTRVFDHLSSSLLIDLAAFCCDIVPSLKNDFLLLTNTVLPHTSNSSAYREDPVRCLSEHLGINLSLAPLSDGEPEMV